MFLSKRYVAGRVELEPSSIKPCKAFRLSFQNHFRPVLSTVKSDTGQRFSKSYKSYTETRYCITVQRNFLVTNTPTPCSLSKHPYCDIIGIYENI